MNLYNRYHFRDEKEMTVLYEFDSKEEDTPPW